jgi:hypothetical protein
MAEHCVRIVFPYADDNLDALFKLEEALEQAILAAGAGEFDGNDVGEGEATLYLYGPDADALFDAIFTVLQTSPLLMRGAVIRRYGPPGDGVSELRDQLPVRVS